MRFCGPVLNGGLTTGTATATAHKQVVDREGRLPIYGDMVRAINCLGNGHLFVSPVPVGPNSSVGLSVSTTLGTQVVGEYDVNADGRIRIARGILNQYLPSKNGVYEISIENDGLGDFILITAL